MLNAPHVKCSPFCGREAIEKGDTQSEAEQDDCSTSGQCLHAKQLQKAAGLGQDLLGCMPEHP